MVWTDCYCPIETKAFTAPLLRLRLLIFARLRLIPFRTGHLCLCGSAWRLEAKNGLNDISVDSAVAIHVVIKSMLKCNTVRQILNCIIFRIYPVVPLATPWHGDDDGNDDNGGNSDVCYIIFKRKEERNRERERMRQKYFVCVPCDCCAAPHK